MRDAACPLSTRGGDRDAVGRALRALAVVLAELTVVLDEPLVRLGREHGLERARVADVALELLLAEVL